MKLQGKDETAVNATVTHCKDGMYAVSYTLDASESRSSLINIGLSVGSPVEVQVSGAPAEKYVRS